MSVMKKELPRREIFMRNGGHYLHCEVLVEQDQRIKFEHRTMVVRHDERKDGVPFIACPMMGTWCEADLSDYAAWMRLLAANVEKIRNHHRLVLIDKYKWNLKHDGEAWLVPPDVHAMGLGPDDDDRADTYRDCLNLCIQYTFINLYHLTLKKGVCFIDAVLLQDIVNEIRWRNQHNPLIPDPEWMKRL